MAKTFILIIVVLLIIFGVGITIVVIGDQERFNELASLGIKGVTFSPKTFDQAGLDTFWTNAGVIGKEVTWSGDWNELEKQDQGAPGVLMTFAPTHDLTPVIIVQFFNQKTGQLLRPLDQTNIDHYKKITRDFISKYKPAYFGMGIEVNLLYDKSPQDFSTFASLFNLLYSEIKIISPDTKVFSVFQLEQMKGLRGGLFGGTNDTSKTDWQIISQFQNIDLVGFTSYPFLVFPSPADIPDNYYTEVTTKTKKPVIFTELGWPSAPVGNQQSSEAMQKDFIDRYFILTKNVKPVFTIWSFMFDENIDPPFNNLGFYDSTGKAKPSLDAWLAVKFKL